MRVNAWVPMCFRVVLSAVLVLLVGVSICIMPGPGSGAAMASPSTGWENQTPVGEGDSLYAVDAVDADVAWVVGNYGTILKTIDSGNTWVQQDAPSTNIQFYDVSAVDNDTAWASGRTFYSEGLLLKTTDGGDTWISLNSAINTFKAGTTPVSMFVSGVAAVDADTVFVCVYCRYVEDYSPFEYWYEAKIWRTDDGGETWATKLHSFVPCGINSIDALDDQVVWAAAGSGGYGSGPTMLVTSNGGWTWDFRYLDVFETYGMYSVSAQDSMKAWAVYKLWQSTLGGIKKTSDGGMTWMTYQFPDDVSPNALAAVDADMAWVVGAPGAIYKTIDGASTWIPQDSGVADRLNGVCAVDENTAWVVGDNGVILKTNDGGGGAPFIYSVNPSSGSAGIEVTVAGYNFGDTQDSSYLSFGSTQATTYIYWSDTEIVAEVPAGITGNVPVTATTSEGTSNPVDFTVSGPLAVTSVTPTEGVQQTFLMEITAEGSGFQPGATLRLEKDGSTVNAINVYLTGETQITGTIGLLGVEPGAYDVVVTNPDTSEARLEDAFTVTSACGEGSGMALLMLGLSLGLLSLAGSSSIRRRRRHRRQE